MDAMSEEEVKRRSQASGIRMNIPSVGDQFTRVHRTDDGNPGRPIRAANLFLDASGMMTWLAFCSGPALKRPNRHIPAPSALWKQFFSGEFKDESVVFDDSLGLPKSIKIFSKHGQLVFQYQVHQSTNVLGWDFPSEFYLVQYQRAGTNSFAIQLTAKGRVTAIKAGVEPKIP
jgi:hypothetical protein